MRQFKAGQLQTGSIYNISSSYALTASYALNGGTGVGGGNYIATGSVTASVSLGTASFAIVSGSSTFMFVSSSGNVGFGTTTPTAKLSVNGKFALVDGGNSVFIGVDTGRNDDGTTNSNVAIGNSALSENIAGTQNVAIGNNSQRSSSVSNNTSIGTNTLLFNTTGTPNTAIGAFSQVSSSTGTFNTSLGTNTLFNNTVDSLHTALGASVLFSLTTGSSNTGIGASSLFSLITGSENNALGRNAGRYYGATGTLANTNASASIFIGFNSRANAIGEINQIVIGNEAVGLGSNTVVLGNNNVTFTALKGNVGIGTTTDAGYKLDVNGTARIQGNTRITGQINFGNNNIWVGAAQWSTGLEMYAISAGNENIKLSPAQQVHISNNSLFTANTSAILQADSTTKGFLPPRTNLTSNISTPAQGLITYLTGSTNEGLYYYSSGSIKSWTRLLNDTGSQAISGSLTITGSNPLLRLNGSGSELMSVDGASGRLFTVSDDLSNSLFSVNTIAGLPVMEAFATNDVFLGKYNTYPIKTVASGTLAVITGSFSGSVVGTLTGTSSFALTASYVLNAVSASYAATASLAPLYLPLTGGTISGNVTVLGTASINTLIVNQIGYSSGSNQLGDAANDVQTLYGTVVIPTGSLTVTGSVNATGSVSINGGLTFTGGANTAVIATSAANYSTARIGQIGGYDFQYGAFNSGQTVVGYHTGLGLNGLTTVGGTSLYIWNRSSPAQAIIFGGQNSAEVFRIANTGRVGFGTTTPSANVDIAGTTRISGSFNTATSGSILTVIGSGSAQPIFTVQGSQGELFSITDSLSGSLFSVNDISGLPILEVFSDNTTLIGNYQDPMLITTAKVVQTNSGSFTMYSLPTASYDTAFFEYSVRSGSNARAGTIMAVQLGSTVNFTETTTTDFGSTSAVSFTVIVTGSNMALTGSSTSGAWTIKTIVRGL